LHNIQLDVRGKGYDDVNWTEQVQEWVQWSTFFMTVMDIRIQ